MNKALWIVSLFKWSKNNKLKCKNETIFKLKSINVSRKKNNAILKKVFHGCFVESAPIIQYILVDLLRDKIDFQRLVNLGGTEVHIGVYFSPRFTLFTDWLKSLTNIRCDRRGYLGQVWLGGGEMFLLDIETTRIR